MDISLATQLKIDKSGWTLVKFGDVVSEGGETVKDFAKEDIQHVVGLEHIDTENIHLTRSETLASSTTFTKKFRKGDVLFGRRRAYLKKAAQATFSGICSGDITVLRAKKDLMPELLPFLVNNDKFFDHAIKHSAGGLSPRVKFKDLANYEFLLPPKDQQAKLAELLWAMDEVVEKGGETKNNLIMLKKILLKDVFSRNWNSSNMFLKNFKISDFPIKKLNDVCVESMFGPRFSSSLYNDNGNVSSLRTTDIDDEGNINLITMPKACIQEGKLKEHFLIIGDLVISRSGTCGLTAVFEGHDTPVIPAAFLIRFRISSNVNPHYLKLFFNSDIGKEITDNLASGAVQKNLTSKALLNIEIPIPNKKFQDEILELIDGLNIEKYGIQIATSQSLQKSLINQIF